MKADVDELRKARPYIRSVLAFLIYIRQWKLGDGVVAVANAYDRGDEFIHHLESDLDGQK